MDVFTEFATDEKVEQEGRWVDFDEKTSFKIARSGNKNFSRLFTRLYNKNRVVLESKGDAAEKASETLLCEVMSTTILLDWKGPVAMKGEDLSTYSVENAKKILAVKDFRKWVSNQSDDFESFKAEQEAEDGKN